MELLRRIILFLGVLLLGCEGINAQVVISGAVTDAKSGETLTGVIIALKSASGKTVKYTTTDAKGQFTLRPEALSQGDSLHASLLGYAPLSVLPTAGQKMSLQMSPEAMNIREVTIRAPKIQMHGDTVRYSVSSFAEAQDKNLGDVLKKMPGIDVDKAGQIKYNGTPINKLYIEGLDMLGGKYSLATNNIPPKDVKSVEVLENHQPTKALQDIAYSEQAALNIKLQEGAKARWIGTADLNSGIGGSIFKDNEDAAPNPSSSASKAAGSPSFGTKTTAVGNSTIVATNSAAGDPALWNANLFGMRIGAKWQSMNTFKSNNTGKNLKSEINTFGFSDIFSENNSYTLRDFFSVGVSNAPLSEERVRLNQSYLFSTNNSFKVAPDYQMNLQASYFHERLSSSNSSQTQYFLGDSTITVSEGKKAATSEHALSANAELLANTERFYLKDNLSFTGGWSGADVSMSGSFPNVQTGDLSSFDISNDFKYTKRIGKQSLSVSSYNQYCYKPQSLDVLRDDGSSQHQDISQRAFYSNTSASYGLNFKKGWSLSMKGGFSAVVRTLESELSGLDEMISANDIRLTHTNLYLQPTLVYKSTKFTASLNVPLNYHHYDYVPSGRPGQAPSTHDAILFSPRLYFKYSITPKFLLTASASLGQNSVNEQNLYDGAILSNYRHLRTGIVDFSPSIAKSITGGFEFKDPINNFFFNGTLLRSWNSSPFLTSQTFAGNYIIDSYIPYSTGSDTWYASIGGSKGFYGISGLLGLDASVTSSSATMLQSTGTSSSTSTESATGTSSDLLAPSLSSTASHIGTTCSSSIALALLPASDASATAEAALTPFSSTAITLSPRFSARLVPWLFMEYHLSYTHSLLELTQTSTINRNDSFSHSLNLTITPIKPLSVKLSAEHYFSQITATQNKNTILADITARYTLSDHIELALTATNILNQRTYTYTTFSGPSSFTAAYQIRPMNLLLGVYWKF